MTEIAERHAPLVQRLVERFGAAWVDETSVTGWLAQGGDRVVLLVGDPVRFPEGVDVAAVPRDHEDAVARRYGCRHWPSLLFFRAGQYVTAIAGMQDWDVYLKGVAAALKMPPSRPPTIGGIPVVGENDATACH